MKQCLHCGSPVEGRRQYCNDSCKTLAYNKRRDTAPARLARLGFDEDASITIIERIGMKGVTALFKYIGVEWSPEEQNWKTINLERWNEFRAVRNLEPETE